MITISSVSPLKKRGCLTKLTVVFCDGKNKIEKDWEVAVTSHRLDKDILDELLYGIIVRYREAEREFAYLEHGNQWRKHVTWGRFWERRRNDEEDRVVAEILKILLSPRRRAEGKNARQ
jgi:hypothetical protein